MSSGESILEPRGQIQLITFYSFSINLKYMLVVIPPRPFISYLIEKVETQDNYLLHFYLFNTRTRLVT